MKGALKVVLALIAGVSLAQGDNQPAQSAAQVGNDGGVEAVREAQASQMQPATRKRVSARKQLKDMMRARGWKERWDEKRGRTIVVESADFKSVDPATDDAFFVKREMAAKKAILSAKVAVIFQINQEMSAEDLFDMPGTDVNKELGAEREAVLTQLSEQQEAVAKLLDSVDQADARVLRGTPLSARLDDLLSAAIKKLDEHYDKNQHDEKAVARLAELKAQHETAVRKLDELYKKAESLQDTVRERQESAVTTMAKMPLYGATVIAQTESWNEESGVYEVAVMLCWSLDLERAARAVVTGEDFKLEADPDGIDIDSWIDKQVPACMVGPRQFVDKEGNRWFLGIAARGYDDSMSSSARRKNKSIAELYAQQMATFCVWADVESYKQAKTSMETRGDDRRDVNVVAESLAEKLTQSFQNKTVRGLQKLYSDEVESPITGTTIYVAIYGLNASAAKDALESEKINYATKVMDSHYQTVERGRNAANAAAVRASENRQEGFNRGFREQAGTIDGELQARQPAAAKTGKLADDTPAVQRKRGKSTGGVFGGDADIKDDF